MHNNKILIMMIITGGAILGIALYSPIMGLITAIVFLLSLFLFINKYDPFPIIFIFCITFISSFNLISVGYFIIIILFYVYIIYFLCYPAYQKKLNTSKFYLFFYLWLVFILFQLILFSNNNSTLEHTISFIFGIMIIFLMSRVINTKERLEMVYNFWAISVLTTIIIAYWEIMTGNSIRSTTAYPHLSVATVGFFNQNNYSFYLGLSLPIMFHWLQGKLIQKVLAIFVIFSTLFIVYVNNSRSVLIIILLFLIILFIKLFSVKKRVIVTILILAVALIMILNIDIINGIYKSLSSLTDSDASVNSRKDLIISGWNIFKENPYFGVGPGNSEYFMPRIGDKVHNFWLEILINYGVFVFIGLISFIVYSIFSFIRNPTVEIKNLIWPLLWSTIILIPISSAPSTIFRYQVLWFFFGLVLCGITIIKNERIQNNTE